MVRRKSLVLPVPSAHRATQLRHIVQSPAVVSASSHNITIAFRSSSMVDLQFFLSLPFLFSFWHPFHRLTSESLLLFQTFENLPKQNSSTYSFSPLLPWIVMTSSPSKTPICPALFSQRYVEAHFACYVFYMFSELLHSTPSFME